MSLRFFAVCTVLIALGCASRLPDSAELRTVSQVDLGRYTGTWYEVATIPSWFQRNCVGTTATYSLREDGLLRVENACRDKTIDGRMRSIVGRAWVTDKTTNAKLDVQFFWPFTGAYWIIALDPDYRYAMVGHPSRDYLWILSRTPEMSEATYHELLATAAREGYDVSRLRRTLQPGS